MNLQILSKRSQWMLALIAAAATISGTIIFYGISQSRPTSKPTVVVKAAPIIRQITALGRLEPATEVIKVSVPATLSNDRVTRLLVQRGDRVRAGQVMAIMDAQARLQNTLFEAQAQVKVSLSELAKVKAGAKSGEIAAQKAEIVRLQEQLKGEIATQQATIARWQAEVRTANSNYNRYLSLYKQGAIASLELEQKQLALETAQTQLNEAKAKQNQSVDTIRQEISQARATLNKIAEVRPVDIQAAQAEVDKAISAANKAKADLAEAYIRAPIAGRIFNIYTKPGEVVGDKGIVDLGQTDQMQVVAEVYQTDIGKVREGQQVVITSESFPNQIGGTVRLVGLEVIKQEITSGQPGENLDRKVIEVRIQLNREDSRRVANLTNLQVQVAIQPNATLTNN
ncbi:HlyD family efflux transporter periplasmic adaptor subunit [Nostoc sp. 106C]|uniref:HlyD family efflux transporter periplasmic adaptor subunit n=1 Tax=Nostoc sp. 106C TaxID=1932667 RepID=UPI000A3694B3|nr:HlyD family efflux transporter periplasmic adaptor subunit [Nostoc sp. 106C]OUL31070.1 HlyD family secretion protein [Nostoc sp. 106C]